MRLAMLLSGSAAELQRPPAARCVILLKNKKEETETDLFVCLNGGPKGSRTPDLLNAIQALSQLSYGPKYGTPNRI